MIFFVVLCIILFAPIIMGKLRIPHIVGMVLAGMVIGPYGLNILAKDASFYLFGHVGLFYIMLLAGLEMNMANFMKNRDAHRYPRHNGIRNTDGYGLHRQPCRTSV